MPDKVFFDTSVVAYLIATEDRRTSIAENLLLQGGSISIQVLNELVAVARRKTSLAWEEIDEVLAAVRSLCSPIAALTLAEHDAALAVARRYGYRIYDALIIASALANGCSTLYSEDMQHGQVIGALTIINPFLR